MTSNKEDFMVKKIFFIAAAVILSLFLTAGSHTIAADKTGFVDLREIMLKSESGKKAADEFSKLYEKDKIAIQEKEAELKKLKEQLEKQRTVLTEAALKEREADYQKRFRDYQRMVNDANEELRRRDKELSEKLIPEILKVIHSIGEKEKYTMIIDVSTIPLAYFSRENDLTQKVIEEFNKIVAQKK